MKVIIYQYWYLSKSVLVNGPQVVIITVSQALGLKPCENTTMYTGGFKMILAIMLIFLWFRFETGTQK